MVYILKVEYVYKINVFGQKMMMKSGLEKIFSKFLHVQSLFQTVFFTTEFALLSTNLPFYDVKMTPFAHGGISIIFFVIYVHTLNETLGHKFHPYSILST